MNFITILLLILGFSSFNQNSNNLETTLLGKWVFQKQENEKTYLKKRARIPRKKFGVKFEKGNKIVLHQNSSWCGTPPISYENRIGTWEVTSDSTIHIILENNSWDGSKELDWLILKNDNNILVIK